MSRWSGFRSAFEGNPQQGTLFDVRDVPSQPVNSPGMQKRGRRQELLDAMPNVDVQSVQGYEDIGYEVANKIANRRGDAIREAEDPSRRLVHETRAAVNQQRRAEVSRQFADETTVRPDHLRGLKGFHEGLDLGPGVAGQYENKEILSPGPMDTGTLTHELGHHVSSRDRGSRVRQGVQDDIAELSSGLIISPTEEARADAFALEHTAERRDTYATRLRGLAEQTRYGLERERVGTPLTDAELEYQGLPKRKRMQQQELL